MKKKNIDILRTIYSKYDKDNINEEIIYNVIEVYLEIIQEQKKKEM